jgi:hypothetical protein
VTGPDGARPVGGIPRVRVAGTPYERGRQYGAQARTRIHRSVQAYQRVFAHYAGWDWPAVRRAAAGFEAPVAAFRPAYLDEMRGLADGAGLDLADVLAINVRTARPRSRPASRNRPPSAAPSPSSRFRAGRRPRSSARTGTGCSIRPRR